MPLATVVLTSNCCSRHPHAGTYIAGEPLVTIAAFAPQLHVISSKQRPRKLTIYGGDGAEYMFLLKVSCC
jgi:phosphatidylinositol kinase/protein kinase (PI-3  family)